MKCLQGHFLVAAPRQADPNFAETVILVVEHSDRGALGVVINRFGGHSQRILAARAAERRDSRPARFYLGGPVTGPVMAVHADSWLGELEILPGVFFSARERNVRSLVRHSQRQPYKLFVGYAGWAPGQLDSEVEEGVWRITAATPEQIFSESGDLWDRLSRRAFPLQLHELFDPNDLSMNPLCN